MSGNFIHEPIATKKAEPEVCGICLENLSYNRRDIHETICGHKFHTCCFRNIIEPKCPYCRRSVEHEPGRKIQLLKKELAKVQYEEQHNVLNLINNIDVEVCEERIRQLRNLLKIELNEKAKMKAVIRNTRLYYKYKKREITNRIKIARVEIKMKTAIKKNRKQLRQNEHNKNLLNQIEQNRKQNAYDSMV